MTLQEVKDFINFAIKEGIYEANDFDQLSEKELIAFAILESDRMDRATYADIEEKHD